MRVYATGRSTGRAGAAVAGRVPLSLKKGEGERKGERERERERDINIA